MAGGKVEGGVESGAMGEWKSKGFGKTPKPSSFWMNTKTDRLKTPTDFFIGDTLIVLFRGGDKTAKHAAASNVNNAPFVADFCKKIAEKIADFCKKRSQKSARPAH